MAAPPSAGETVPFDAFVDERIAKTRAAVKTADVAVGVVTLVAGLLVLLLAAAIADHWLVAGGLDRWERYALLGVGLAGAGLYVATRLGPLVLRRVNPLYAAREIERESPQLKNSLLNLLQLRGELAPAAVRQTLERQAAERLAGVGETPIDHTPAVRAAKTLLALVALVGLYVVVTPKDFFASAGRVLAPWADILPPSRVRITAVTPGNARVAQGDSLELSAEVAGLREGELVEIVYTSADRRFVNRRVAMRGVGVGPWTVALPPESGATRALGLQQDFTYRVEAGDARTSDYRVEVAVAPTIAPVLVRYEPPAYTGLEPREVEGVGDLRGLEGTRVLLTAEANLPVESAEIDLGADGRPDVRLRPEGVRATGSFTLRLAEEGRSAPTEYVLRFASPDGSATHSPPRRRIEVIADLPPEAAVLSPEAVEIEVSVDRPVRLEVEARDPDFALSRVRLVGERGGRTLLERDLLRGDGRGRFVAETEVTPAEIGLKPGEVLEYFVEALDNRTPQPRRGVSERRRLRVVGPTDPARPGDSGEDGEPQPGEGEGDRSNEGAAPGTQRGAGEDAAGRPQGAPPQPGASGDAAEQGESPSDEAKPQPGESQPNKSPPEPEEPAPQQNPAGGVGGPGQQSTEAEPEDSSPGAGNAAQGESGDQSGDDQQTGAGAGGGSSPSPGDTEGPPGAQRGPTPPGGNGANPGQQPEGPAPSDGGGDARKPVPSDGSDDRSAFDRIQDWLKGTPPAEGGDSQPSRPDAGREGAEPAEDESPSGSKPRNDGEGAGAEPQPGAGDEPGGEAPDDSAKPSAGAGERQPAGQGPPDGPSPDRPADGPGAGDQDRRGAQSDSRSSESGEEAPPGQPSDPRAGPREGTGDSGQNQAADRGAGQSADRGPGETSGRPGDDSRGDSAKGGESAGERGEGGRTRDSAEGVESPRGGSTGGDSKGGNPGPDQGKPTGETGSGAKPGASSDGESGSDGDRGALGDRRGEGPSDGGKPGDLGGPQELVDRGAADSGPGEGAGPGGDAANLEYARRQTDLVLRRLEEELKKKEIDRRLLEKLGWSEEDLRRFLARWEERRAGAEERGEEGRVELDRALRSLGLRPGGPSATAPSGDDALRDLREGVRTKTPPRLRDALEAYQKSLGSTPDAASEER